MKELLSCEQTPSWIYPSLLHSTNLLSLLVKPLIHIHVLIIEPCLLLMGVMLVCSQSLHFIHASTFPFRGPNKQPRTHLPVLCIPTPYSTPTPCPLRLPLPSVSTPFSLPPSSHHSPLFSVCLRKGLAGTKEKRGNDRDTDDITKECNENTMNAYIKPTFVSYHCLHIHHSTVYLVNERLEDNWGQPTLIKASAAKNSCGFHIFVFVAKAAYHSFP